MLKRKILAAVLPVVAAATVVGSGFSAWYFESGTDLTANTSVNVSVEGSTTSKGSLTFSWIGSKEETTVSNAELVLDQGEYANREDNTKGISFKDSSDDSNEITALKLTYANENMSLLDKANLKVNLEIKITISSDVNKYVTFATDSTGKALDYNILPEGMSSTIDTEHSKNIAVLNINGIQPGDFSINLSTGSDKANGLLRYYSTSEVQDSDDGIYGKPQDIEEYNVMNTAFNSNPTAITFDAKATIVEG